MILAWLLAITIVAIAACIDAIVRARHLGLQRTLANLAAHRWEQFEEVIADAIRRHGYRVCDRRCGTPDAEVDLVLTGNGGRRVVQAKH